MGIQDMLCTLGLRRRTPAFLHIPKTGGTYLVQRESDDDPVISPMSYLGHCCAINNPADAGKVYPPKGYLPNYFFKKSILRRYAVFSTVRNPYSILVSWMHHAGGLNPKYVNPDGYDYEMARKGFDYFLKTVAERAEPWPNRRLIHTQLFSDDGDLVVDWINRNETLDDDVAAFAAAHHATYRQRERQRVGVREDYRTFYTDELAELVAQVWGRELWLFGYDLDGVVPGRGVLHRAVAPAQKAAIRYDYAADRLVVDGREIHRDDPILSASATATVAAEKG